MVIFGYFFWLFYRYFEHHYTQRPHSHHLRMRLFWYQFMFLLELVIGQDIGHVGLLTAMSLDTIDNH